MNGIRDQFSTIGRRLFSENLIGGNFGNMSAREGVDQFLITRTGSYLDDPGELVLVPLQGEVPSHASSEWKVHRSIYERTPGVQAIVHAHPPYSVAASIVMDELIPLDSEGKMFCPKIQIVNGDPGTQDLADQIAEALSKAQVCIARGHGTFATGETLQEAYLYTSIVEHASRIISLIPSFRS